MCAGALSDRIYDAAQSIKQLQMSIPYRKDTNFEVRVMRLEQDMMTIAKAIEVLLEAKEKKLWPV